MNVNEINGDSMNIESIEINGKKIRIPSQKEMELEKFYKLAEKHGFKNIRDTDMDRKRRKIE